MLNIVSKNGSILLKGIVGGSYDGPCILIRISQKNFVPLRRSMSKVLPYKLIANRLQILPPNHVELEPGLRTLYEGEAKRMGAMNADKELDKKGIVMMYQIIHFDYLKKIETPCQVYGATSSFVSKGLVAYS
jgi:hypothetical protein